MQKARDAESNRFLNPYPIKAKLAMKVQAYVVANLPYAIHTWSHWAQATKLACYLLTWKNIHTGKAQAFGKKTLVDLHIEVFRKW